MVIRRLIAPHIDFSALRRELKLPTQFSPAAQREVEQVVASGPEPVVGRVDRTDIDFVTIDPPTSRDLDQAMRLERRPGGGYRVWYAIADVSVFVTPGGALVADTWSRGQTVYLPDGKVPLHPAVLSEAAASLLADQVRPAVVWIIDLGADGATVAVHVERSTVRSRAKLDYPSVEAGAAQGHIDDPIALLPEIGKLLIERGLARGGINLPIPSQEIEPVDGGWELVLKAPTAIEDYNAQISLLTGMAAAEIMLTGKIGLLRTMPRPDAGAVAKLKMAAGPLGIPWPDGESAGRVIGAVDGSDPRGAAFLDHAAELFRGAGYTPFDGDVPALHEHGGVAAPYAHVTAPLRRLADRYTTEVCLALYQNVPVPDWARTALPKLPDVMTSTDRVASAAERGAIDLTEAVLLQDRVGEHFDAAVLDIDEPKHHGNRNGNGRGGNDTGGNGNASRGNGGQPEAATVTPPAVTSPAMAPPAMAPPAVTSPAVAPLAVAAPALANALRGMVAIDSPAVRARCEGAGLELGKRIPVRLAVADPITRRVLFETLDL